MYSMMSDLFREISCVCICIIHIVTEIIFCFYLDLVFTECRKRKRGN